MSQVRDNLRKQWRSMIIAMGIVIGIVVGCGGGGGGGSQSADSGSSSTQRASAASSTVNGGNNIILAVQRAASKLPSTTVRVRATIVGTNISATADFGPDVLAVTLELFSPLGPQTVRIDALDADGNVVATGELQVTVGSGPSTPVTVPVDSLAATSPTPTPAASPSPTPAPSPSSSPSPSPSQIALRFGVQPPQPVLSTFPFAVAVEAFNPATNQLVSSFNGPVTVSLSTNPGGDTLPATTVNAVNGVATFNQLVISHPAAGYQLQASSPGQLSGLSNTFAVVQGALKFIVQPAATQPFGAPMLPQSTGIQVAIVDGNGNTIPVNGFAVSMTASPNARGVALLGATSVATVNGVATFKGLQMNASGLGFTLVATAGSISPLSSSPFNVGPAVSPGTVYIIALTEVGQISTIALAGYDINTLQPIAAPSTIVGYTPLAISVWPGNANAGAAVLVLGDDNTVHFYNPTTLQELAIPPLTLPTSTGTPNINPSTPQLIKKDPARDIFYVTAQNSNGDLIDIIDISGGPAAATASAASGLGGSHGLGVDPGNAGAPPAFVVTQGDFGLEGDTINPGPPVTLTGAGSGGTPLAGTDSYLDVAYIDGAALALNTYGNIPLGANDKSITWIAISGNSPSGFVTSLDTYGQGAANDVRNDVRYYQTIDGNPTSTGSALVCDQTSNLLEMVTVTFTSGGGSAIVPHFPLGGVTVTITDAVTDPNAIVKSPGRLGLSMKNGTFVQGFSTSVTSQQVPVVDLLTGGHPTVYGSIDLGANTVSTAAAVLQAGEPITGQ